MPSLQMTSPQTALPPPVPPPAEVPPQAPPPPPTLCIPYVIPLNFFWLIPALLLFLLLLLCIWWLCRKKTIKEPPPTQERAQDPEDTCPMQTCPTVIVPCECQGGRMKRMQGRCINVALMNPQRGQLPCSPTIYVQPSRECFPIKNFCSREEYLNFSPPSLRFPGFHFLATCIPNVSQKEMAPSTVHQLEVHLLVPGSPKLSPSPGEFWRSLSISLEKFNLCYLPFATIEETVLPTEMF
ncbi:anthrax toxin receptor-like [Camelus ferus]|uniref:Anthrax toxin receptor-like n=1 Tax=Camelus ferus TaxID=419612 RepID=A0A8B8U1H3_CAMFR|nr:anthrax toxin receptor-like [Camelus ferus]